MGISGGGFLVEGMCALNFKRWEKKGGSISGC